MMQDDSGSVNLSTISLPYSSGPRIEDYALIGDCRSAALVSIAGSIDWLCWPRFDSPACFAALLGDDSHGSWTIAAESPEARVARAYSGNSLVLETTWETSEGAARVIDFMSTHGGSPNVVRIVEGLRGAVAMRTALAIRFSYGSVVPWVSRAEDGTLHAVAGPDMVVLRSDVALHGSGLTTVGSFVVEAGASFSFVLAYGPSEESPPDPVEPAFALTSTKRFWTEWASRCTYDGPWKDAVLRSLLTLKALTFTATGGIVAAPTCSLPEFLGGTRNWDYRFCWLRDATFSLLALMDAGYFDEAEAWRNWLIRAVAGSPGKAQIMYGLAGERLLLEWEVPWLPGFVGSRPVRVGNAAHDQFQLDVYGEVLDALHQARLGGIRETEQAWHVQCSLANHVESTWQSADHGLWETRSEPRHFTHSKVMAWVAMARMIDAAERNGLPAPLERWRATRDRVHADVCARAFDERRQSFTQSYGAVALDASTLLMPLVGFLPATDPRIAGTVRAIEEHLIVDGLVLRYDTVATKDGLPPGEGAFLACSFWLADVYALQGRLDESRALFERLLSLRNDVGLLSEEYDPVARRFLGNFPQAFSHVALVATGLNLGRSSERRPATQRGSIERPALTR